MRVFSYPVHPGRFDPINALQRLQAEFERVFESASGLDFGPSGSGVFPAVNIFALDAVHPLDVDQHQSIG